MDFKVPCGTIENFIRLNFKEAKTTSNGEIHFNSPFVVPYDTKLRCYVNLEKNSWFDQKEQRGGKFLSFVSEYLDIGLKEAAILLIREYGSVDDEIKYENVVQVHKDIELPPGLKWFFESKNESRSLKLAKKYLRSRGIEGGDLGYVYDPKGDFKETYHNRILIPFYEEGRLVYFIGRSFDDSTLRFKNPSGIDAGNFVFQIDKLKDDVFIFEGAFDALSLHEPQVGTAMLSNKLKQVQITKILDRAPKRVIFITENDKNEVAIKAGKRNLGKNLKEMMKYKAPSQHIEFYIYTPPLEYKDFNEYSAKADVHHIDIEKDCIRWNPNSFNVGNLKWGRV